MATDSSACWKCNKRIASYLEFCTKCGAKQVVPFTDSEKRKNPYEILQVSRNAEQEVIDAAYKGLAKKYHPDINKSTDADDKLKDINWAYDILSNEAKKAKWDAESRYQSSEQAKNGKKEEKKATQSQKVDFQKKKETPKSKGKFDKKKDISRNDVSFIWITVIVLVCIFITSLLGVNYTRLFSEGRNSEYVTDSELQATQKPPPNTLLPSHTITQTPSKTRTPTLTFTPTQMGHIFIDDFTNRNSGWLLSNYYDRRLRLIADEAYLFTWDYPGIEVSDISMEVYAKLVDGSPNGVMGLICRHVDENNFYSFNIDVSGYYSVYKLVDDAFETITDWNRSTSIKNKGWNHLRVDCVGNYFHFYANDVLLVTFQDSEFQSGDIGLSASSYETPGVEILYDNLKILNPNYASKIPTNTPKTSNPSSETNNAIDDSSSFVGRGPGEKDPGDVSVELRNETGRDVTMFLNGPAMYTLTIPPGTHIFYVKPGAYSFNYYSCGMGPESGWGNFNSAWYWTFSCEER